MPPDAAFPDLTRASLSAAAVEKLSKAALMDSKVSAPTMVSESTSSVDSPSKKKFNVRLCGRWDGSSHSLPTAPSQILNRPKKASALLAAVQTKDVPALRTELATSLKPSALFDPQSKASALIVCASQSKGTSVDLGMDTAVAYEATDCRSKILPRCCWRIQSRIPMHKTPLARPR